VTGDEGQLVMRNASLYGRKIGMDNHMGEEMLYLDTASNSNLDKASNSKNSSNSALPDLYVEGYTRLFRQLKETLLSQDNKHKLATFEDALHTASVIEAVRKSSREKVWAKVAMER
jgi:predicted dehydrogenase